jgi:hypothetical protein
LDGRTLAEEIDAQDEDDDNCHVQSDIHQVLLKELLPGISGHQFQLVR